MSSFGTDFILVSDVRQDLDPVIFRGGPWIHLATVKRGFDEYVCFTHKYRTKATYIEKVDVHEPGVFKQIEDQNLWVDLWNFLDHKGCLRRDKFKQANAPQ